MFINRVYNNTSKNLHIVRIDGIDLENLGLYLDKDCELRYKQEEEIELKYIAGRDMPYHKKIRNLPIEFSIIFNLKETVDFYERIDNIKTFLNNSKEKLITFNNENRGFKIYWVSLGDINRIKGQSKVTINFMCYPIIESVTI